MSAKRKPDEGRYSKVSRRVWGSSDFRALSAPKPNAQTLWFRLLTGPELGIIPGLFEMSEAGMAERMGWPLAAFRRCLLEITSKSMAAFDKGAGLMWVPKAIHHNPPDNPNVVLGWRVPWRELPDCATKDAARVHLYEWCSQKGPQWVTELMKVTGNVGGNPLPTDDPNPGGNKEQEQEQEKEQEIPPTPQSSELAERAKRWVALADAGHGQGRGEADLRFGDPARWPETKAVCDAMRATWGRTDEPRHSGDPRARVVVERFAEGYSVGDLVEAIRGSKNALNIAENREYQALKTILRDAAQVDKFRALAKPEAAPQADPSGLRVKSIDDIMRAEGA